MIFVTVGTHEDPFDRLVAAAERLAVELGEEVVVQAGTSRVPTPHCERHGMLPPSRFDELVRRARVVVTHAGPASIRGAWVAGSIPIVVPRDPAHGEHVDGHQLAFARRMADRVHLVEDTAELVEATRGHQQAIAHVRPLGFGAERTEAFATLLGELVDDLVGRRRAAERDTVSPRRTPPGRR